MRIEYDLTPEDWAAFGEYHARASSEFRRAMWTWVVIGIVMIAALVVQLVNSTHSFWWIAAGLAFAAAWVWYVPRKTIANVRSTMASNVSACVRGRHIMEARPDGLRAKCDLTDSLIAWPGIRDVIETRDHVFVMIAPRQGYTVPRKLVTAGDLDGFVQEVARLRAAA